MILVAHPDDEAIGCGALLQRVEDPVVIFATDGAPRSEYFWKAHNSRERYARVRAMEAERALRAVGVKHFHFLCESDPIVDQELYLQLDRAFTDLRETLDAEMPDAILTLAYEGGHPDHDCCSFMATLAAREFGLPAWEMPLYHRQGETFRPQQFLHGQEGMELDVLREEMALKLRMWREYESQAGVMREFVCGRERFRPLHDYDYWRPPHPGVLNYEAWQWPMTGNDLCRAFSALALSISNRKNERGTAAW